MTRVATTSVMCQRIPFKVWMGRSALPGATTEAVMLFWLSCPIVPLIDKSRPLGPFIVIKKQRDNKLSIDNL